MNWANKALLAKHTALQHFTHNSNTLSHSLPPHTPHRRAGLRNATHSSGLMLKRGRPMDQKGSSHLHHIMFQLSSNQLQIQPWRERQTDQKSVAKSPNLLWLIMLSIIQLLIFHCSVHITSKDEENKITWQCDNICHMNFWAWVVNSDHFLLLFCLHALLLLLLYLRKILVHSAINVSNNNYI